MLNLRDVTLIGMDCMDPLRTIKAMRYSMYQVGFADAVLVTSRQRFNDGMLKHIGGAGRLNIRVEFTEQGGREDYERALICDLHKHFRTSHCLFMEWDSGVLDPYCWDGKWLDLDFIGAPWPYAYHQVGYPPCTEANCVGNGGFSLRSHRFCLAGSSLFNPSDKTTKIHDAWLCRTVQGKLKGMGIHFADFDTAERFCLENRIIAGRPVFGFHGKNTIAMNGWRWNFDWMI